MLFLSELNLNAWGFLFQSTCGKHVIILKKEIWVWCFEIIKKKNFWNNYLNFSLKGGGRPIPLHLQKGIECYLKENSNIASNRMVKIKSKNNLNSQRYIPVRYLQDTKIELFNKSPFKNLISKSTFYKYLNTENQFKNPHR